MTKEEQLTEDRARRVAEDLMDEPSRHYGEQRTYRALLDFHKDGHEAGHAAGVLEGREQVVKEVGAWLRSMAEYRLREETALHAEVERLWTLLEDGDKEEREMAVFERRQARDARQPPWCKYCRELGRDEACDHKPEAEWEASLMRINDAIAKHEKGEG